MINYYLLAIKSGEVIIKCFSPTKIKSYYKA